MLSVELLMTEFGRLTVPVGRIDFYRLPVQTSNDFICEPADIVSFDDAQTISVQLFRQCFRGKVDRYQWRKSNVDE
jgi:hypothetical protein